MARVIRHFGGSVLPAAILATALLAGNAPAASIIYGLNNSNEEGVFPDGGLPAYPNYLTVKIDEIASGIQFTVATVAGVFSEGSNFGIQSFGFNTPGGLALTSFSLPTSWSVDTNRAQDGFGKFDWVVSNTGNNRQDPLAFTLTGATTVGDVSGPSSNPAGQGNAWFAAHVAGFTTSAGVSSAWFGGGTADPGPGGAPPIVPVPAAVWLFGSAILGLVAVSRRQNRAL